MTAYCHAITCRHFAQTTFPKAFLWMKMYEFRLRIQWSLFPMFEWTIPALVQLMALLRSSSISPLNFSNSIFVIQWWCFEVHFGKRSVFVTKTTHWTIGPFLAYHPVAPASDKVYQNAFWHTAHILSVDVSVVLWGRYVERISRMPTVATQRKVMYSFGVSLCKLVYRNLMIGDACRSSDFNEMRSCCHEKLHTFYLLFL